MDMAKYVNDVLKDVNGDLGELKEIGYLTEEEADAFEKSNFTFSTEMKIVDEKSKEMAKKILSKNGGMQFEIISLFPDSAETTSLVSKDVKGRHQKIYQGKSQIYASRDPYVTGKYSKKKGGLDPYSIPDEVA